MIEYRVFVNGNPFYELPLVQIIKNYDNLIMDSKNVAETSSYNIGFRSQIMLTGEPGKLLKIARTSQRDPENLNNERLYSKEREVLVLQNLAENFFKQTENMEPRRFFPSVDFFQNDKAPYYFEMDILSGEPIDNSLTQKQVLDFVESFTFYSKLEIPDLREIKYEFPKEVFQSNLSHFEDIVDWCNKNNTYENEVMQTLHRKTLNQIFR